MKDKEVEKILKKLSKNEITYDNALYNLLIICGVINKKTGVKYSVMNDTVLKNGNWKKKGSLYWNWKHGTKTIDEAYTIIIKEEK